MYQHRNSIQVSPAADAERFRIVKSSPFGWSSITHRPRAVSLKSPDESFEDHSSVAPSVFSDPGDQEGHVSDVDTDISSTSAGDYALPGDVDRDDRLTRPEKYFADLESLEATVAGNSGLFLMTAKNRQSYPSGKRITLKFPFSSLSPTTHGFSENAVSYDEEIMSFCQEQAVSTSGVSDEHINQVNPDLHFWAFHMLECRNLMLSVMSNIDRMRSARFCGPFISLLVLDSRRKTVVNLVRVTVEKICQLHRSLEEAIQSVLSLIRSPRPQRGTRLQDVRDSISSECDVILESLGLPLSNSVVGKWRRTAMILDLAIISYCGAHQERFDQQYIQEDLNFSRITPAWTYDTLSREHIMLRRRRLRCLDKLLQTPVWVFQDNSRWQDNETLYLSTHMETFADIWGPVWSKAQDYDTSFVFEFKVGLGSLTAWPTDQSTPELEAGEVFCHWSSFDDPRSKKALKRFQSNSKVLIGAQFVEQTTSQLKENLECTNRTNRVIQDLRSTNRLQELGTSDDEKYLAEESVTAQFGYSGITLGGNKTYKRRQGVNLKQAIFEEWKHNSGSRNPTILEQWLGVEVSFCSGNARRRRLKQILSSTTINNWLDSCKDFSEITPCEQAFKDALRSEDPKAFRVLWNQHREWRKELGQLVSWCLEGLLHSKLDVEGTLHVLWMPKPAHRMIVKIRQSRAAWTGFLADSRDHCAMAVMSGKCLKSDYKYASQCQTKLYETRQPGYSVLETALVINERAPMPSSLERRSPESEKVS